MNSPQKETPQKEKSKDKESKPEYFGKPRAYKNVNSSETK